MDRCQLCQVSLADIASIGCDHEGGCEYWVCAPCAGFPTTDALTYFWRGGGKWYCPQHLSTPIHQPPDQMETDDRDFRKRWTLKATVNKEDACSRFITRLGWFNVMTDDRIRARFPLGYISPGMPYIDEFGVMYIPVPGISPIVQRIRKLDLLHDTLQNMMSEPFAPDQIVRNSTTGRLGRVIGWMHADAPIVTALDRVPSKVGMHWGIELHDAFWYGMLFKSDKSSAWIPCLPNETRAQRNRRYALMDSLLNTTFDSDAHKARRIWSERELVFVLPDTLHDWTIQPDDATTEEQLEAQQRQAYGF